MEVEFKNGWSTLKEFERNGRGLEEYPLGLGSKLMYLSKKFKMIREGAQISVLKIDRWWAGHLGLS